MESTQQIWQETVKLLEKIYDRREAENITSLLFMDLFQISRVDVLLNTSEHLLDTDALIAATNRLLSNEPVQYVTGKAHFYGHDFIVNSDVLIPRPETEELVDLIINENEKDRPTILDIGTGSGCLPISLQIALNGQAYGLDISEKALDVASQNAKQLFADVSFLKLDILHEPIPLEPLDVLVSNPPYIPISDRHEIGSNVLDFEPELALFVEANDPLLFYKKIAKEGNRVLKSDGKLYFEIHEKHGKGITDLLVEYGYHTIKVHRDMQGKDRMVSCSK